MRYFNRSHQSAEAPGRLPVPAVRDTVEKPRPVRIAAAGRIDDACSLNAWDFVALTTGDDQGALGAEGADQGLHAARELLERFAGLFLQHLALVVVHGDVVRILQELRDLAAGEHRQALAGIEQE